jgi:hypothetical protein
MDNHGGVTSDEQLIREANAALESADWEDATTLAEQRLTLHLGGGDERAALLGCRW